MKIIKKILKWTGYILAGVLLTAVGAYVYFFWNLNSRLETIYSYQVPEIKVNMDSATVGRGRHLYIVHGCADCHGKDLSGKQMFDDFILGSLSTKNLTHGKNGIPSTYSDADYFRALKHGVNREGKPLLIMPSNETTKIPDEDLSALIAYIKSHPDVDKEVKDRWIGPVGYMLLATGKLPVDIIDHNIKKIEKPEQQVTVEFGSTLAINCQGCHRENYKGGPPLAPGYPEVPNITAEGRPGKWTEEEFIRTLRTGMTPDGHKLDNSKMPWERFKDFSDIEIKAIRKFLLSLPKNNQLAKS